MKWQSIVAGALASVLGTLFIAGSASADVRIVNDPRWRGFVLSANVL
jgi:hypothetical protein